MSRDTPLIVARDLTKRFKNFTAVDGVSFAVHPAESFGFLGPNGAGKTSTMRMMGCGWPVLGRAPQPQASAIKARLGGGATLGWPEAPPDDRARSHQPLVLLVVGGINGRPVLLSPLAIFAFPAAVLAAMSFSALFV